MLLYCKGGNSLAASRAFVHIVLLVRVLPKKGFGWGEWGMNSKGGILRWLVPHEPPCRWLRCGGSFVPGEAPLQQLGVISEGILPPALVNCSKPPRDWKVDQQWHP